MSTTSKSPRKVAAVAYDIGQRTLPEYASPFSRKDFTLPQLFACLVLRKFHKTDYRGIIAILTDNPTLCKDLDLQKVPHFTTLQKAERKLLDDRSHRNMLDQTLAMCFDLDDGTEKDDTLREAQAIEKAAADSTGFDLDYASRYFTHRKRKPWADSIPKRNTGSQREASRTGW